MKKLIALLLAIMTLCMAIVACDGDGDSSNPDTSATSSAGTASGDSSNNDSDVSKEDEVCWLPEKKWNTTLKFAATCEKDQSQRTEDYNYFQFWCDEDLGDSVSKAVYNRSQWLVDNYGITFEMIWNPVDNFYTGAVSYVEECVATGEALDGIIANSCYIVPSAQKGYFYDLNAENAKYNDGNGWAQFDQDYYNVNVHKQLSIGGKMFFTSGDSLLLDDQETWVMLCNLDMFGEYFPEDDLLEIVEDGEWDYDVLYSYAKVVTEADPSVGRMQFSPDANEKWGLIAQGVDSLMFMLGGGVTMIGKDGNDLPVLQIQDQRNVDVAQKFISFITDRQVVGLTSQYSHPNIYDVQKKIFTGGKALFMPGRVSSLTSSSFANIDFKLALIPMPKADSELQDDYSSSINPYGISSIAIPVTNKNNVEATLFAIEALSWYGKKYVRPEYYEKTIKLQKLDDERAEVILDKIFNNRIFDMGPVYNWGDMIQFYNELIGSGSTGADKIISACQKKESIYRYAIDSAITAFKDVGKK